MILRIIQKQVTMPLSGQALPFEYKDGMVSISVAEDMQSQYADAIKVEM